MPSELHHVGVTVGNLDRSVSWYCANLDLVEIARTQIDGPAISAQTGLPGSEIDVALLAGSNSIVELLCYRAPVGGKYRLRPCDVGAAHVCVVVKDLMGKYEAMRGRGVHFQSAPTQLVGATTMVYATDPDGIVVELIEPEGDLTLAALLRMQPLRAGLGSESDQD